MVRSLFAVSLLGVVLLSAEAATAANEIARTSAGITCSWPTTSADGAAICRRANTTGLAVIVARRFVAVRTWRNAKVLFIRNQPEHSHGFGSLNDKRIFHSETHRGIVCYWSKVAGGTALCNRADRHGYVGGVSRFQAMVLNEDNKIVFLRNQP